MIRSIAALVVAVALAQTPQPAEQRVLFIGNSLTYVNDLPKMVESLARAKGLHVTTDIVAFADYSLEDHWQRGDAVRKIRQGRWSLVVLQQGPSAMAESQVLLREYVKRFDGEIRKAGARTGLYMVWPSRSRMRDFDGVSASYSAAARDVSGLLFPVGDAWRAAWRRDASLALYSADGLHPTREGTYLAALVIVTKAFGISPLGLPAPGITPPTARLLQEIVSSFSAFALRASAGQAGSFPPSPLVPVRSRSFPSFPFVPVRFPEDPAMADMHEIDYKIFGDDMQFVEVELDPNEATVAEAGGMMYMDDGVEMETIFGDGSKQQKAGGFMGALMGAGKRLLTGESLFMTVFLNRSTQKRRVAFGAPYPGKIVPVHLAEIGGVLIAQKDSFLAAAKGVSIGIAFQKKLGVGLFGGEGFIMQRLEGDGWAFVHAGGTLTERTLAPGEIVRVDTGCIVAMQPSVNYDIQYVGKIKTALFGGEGLFFATLTGPGKIWLQSLPLSRLANRIVSAVPGIMRGGKEEGSVLGALGGLLDGDN